MSNVNVNDLARKLSDLSVKTFYSPYESIVFPETLDKENWFMSSELISIADQPEYAAMNEVERKVLSFYETVNFFSLNIHGEKSLLEGLAARLYQDRSKDESRYLHHFLDEENKHMIFFGTFCTRYAGKLYRDRKLVFAREYAPGEEELLFFLKVLIFEEIVDHYNVTVARDARLFPLAREINQAHHKDEVRHLAFGRVMVQKTFAENASKWGQDTLDGIRDYVESYMRSTWREYYNPDVYRDAGLNDPYEIAERAYADEAQRERRRLASAGCVKFLMETGILLQEPKL